MKYQIIVADCPWAARDNLTMSAVPRGASSNYDTMDVATLSALPVEQLADPDGCILALWCLGSMLPEALAVMNAWNFTNKQTYVWAKTKKEPLAQISDVVRETLASFDAGLEQKDFTSPGAILNSAAIKKLRKMISSNVDAYKTKLTEMLGFGMGHIFRQTHEICLIGINNTSIYKKITNKSQRSVCFANNEGHSIKPEVFQDSLEKLFEGQDINKCELFGRRTRAGWDVVGNECPDSMNEDIIESIN